jgi:hypothetical protein
LVLADSRRNNQEFEPVRNNYKMATKFVWEFSSSKVGIMDLVSAISISSLTHFQMILVLSEFPRSSRLATERPKVGNLTNTFEPKHSLNPT